MAAFRFRGASALRHVNAFAGAVLNARRENSNHNSGFMTCLLCAVPLRRPIAHQFCLLLLLLLLLRVELKMEDLAMFLLAWTAGGNKTRGAPQSEILKQVEHPWHGRADDFINSSI